MSEIVGRVGKQPLWQRVDKAAAASVWTLLLLAALAPSDLLPVAASAASSLVGTGPYILIAVLLIACLKATGAEAVAARAFRGNEIRMIVLASLVGGLAPFCSCEVVPFIAALLAAGTPLSAVMAFWLSSPIMDPPMFVITAGALGVDFALAKTAAAVAFGLAGGFLTMLVMRQGLIAHPLRVHSQVSCCGTDRSSGRPVWSFWREANRRAAFFKTAIWNGTFLLKWLTLAYLLEAVMLRFVPAQFIVSVLGGDGFWPILTGAMIGGPAYLNGYAAVPIVAGMLEQGMSPGAAMSFVLAGSVTCIPAAIAVWALVKPKVFLIYAGFGIALSLAGGLLWAGYA